MIYPIHPILRHTHLGILDDDDDEILWPCEFFHRTLHPEKDGFDGRLRWMENGWQDGRAHLAHPANRLCLNDFAHLNLDIWMMEFLRSAKFVSLLVSILSHGNLRATICYAQADLTHSVPMLYPCDSVFLFQADFDTVQPNSTVILQIILCFEQIMFVFWNGSL